MLSSFNFPSRRAVLPQKDAGSICTTNLKGVAISQKFKESFREILSTKHCGKFAIQEASEIGASKRHPDVMVLMRNYLLCLLVTIHCGHTFLKH